LAPNAQFLFNFTATADFSAIGMHTLTAWINDSLDGNGFNDTLQDVIETVLGVYTLPWSDDFESFDLCSVASDCQATICPLKNGFFNVQSGTDDDIDWRTNEGPTPTVNSGPDMDHNPGTPAGNYLYTEASGGCFSMVARVISPCVDLSGSTNPRLTFWYHMYGADMGELHVDLFDNGAWINNIMTPVVGDQGNAWHKASVDLTAYAGNTVKFRLSGITGPNGTASDMAIDDFGVAEAVVIDAGLNSVAPAPGTLYSNCDDLSQTVISIDIHNDGIDTISAVPVSYSINGGPAVTDVFPGPLAPLATANFSFSTTADLSAPGTYDIKAWVGVAGDGNNTNDTLLSSVETIQGLFTLPWAENFETFDLCDPTAPCGLVCDLKNGFVNVVNGTDDDIDWRINEGDTPSDSTGPSTDWNPGTPAGNYLYTEASGGCFGQMALLVSPCLDLSGTTNPELSYKFHMYGNNMGELHTDIYNNGSWISDVIPPYLGNYGNSWLLSTVNLSAYAGNIIKFRLRGITGNQYQSDIAIDDIQAYEQTGIHENQSDNGQLFVSPNPNNGMFTIMLNKAIEGKGNMYVLDMQGRSVFNKSFENRGTVYTEKLDLSSLAKGIYTLQAVCGERIYQVKLCIF
jgi:hypothetical protein